GPRSPLGRDPARDGSRPGDAGRRRRNSVMLNPELLQRRIAEAIPSALVEVRDLTGTGDHFEAQVVSSTFLGKSMIEQHQECYAAVQDLLKTGEVHALALKTFTPEQWKTLRPLGD